MVKPLADLYNETMISLLQNGNGSLIFGMNKLTDILFV